MKNVKTSVSNGNVTQERLGGDRVMAERRRKVINLTRERTFSPNSLEEVKEVVQRASKFAEPETIQASQNISYSCLVNSWLSLYTILSTTEKFEYDYRGDSDRRVKCTTTTTFATKNRVLEIVSMAHGRTQKHAKEMLSKQLLNKLKTLRKEIVPKIQMDTEQGDMVQDSSKESNTIITRDSGETKSAESGVGSNYLQQVCSTEELHQFDSVMNRWMTLPGLNITTTMVAEQVVATYPLPSFLFSENTAPNIMPFENFVLGLYDIEFKFVVNANKFHVGKILVSVKYDSYQMTDRRNGLVAALCRPHIILDLSVNNEGTLCVPFKYHRTFVRNAVAEASQYGLVPAQYAEVKVIVLSPLGAIAGAPQSMFIRPFYRIKRANLTGMSYRLPVTQMERLVLEESLKYAGRLLNLDKPVDLERQQQVIPKTRLNFSSGKGASDATPLRMDPAVITTMLPDHHYPDDPVDMLDIAKIWGLAWTFDWKASDVEGKILASQFINPTYHSVGTTYSGTPTPLEYVCSMYQFWSGPIELRFDFVSNAFHTGSIMISAEFGRQSGSIVDSSSAYTKTFHLGDQKSVSFVVPYIFDNPYRRTSTTPWTPLGEVATDSTPSRLGQNALIHEVTSRVTVRVINALVPITSVTQNIQVLVFWRASPSFSVKHPIMTNMVNNETMRMLDNFPGNYSTQLGSRRTTNRSLPLEANPGSSRTLFDPPIPPQRKPLFYVNHPMDSKLACYEEGNVTYCYIKSEEKWKPMNIGRLPRTQMDTGAKETLDTTQNFKLGVERNFVMDVDNHTNIKDLLRRPVQILNNVSVSKFQASSDNDANVYYIPCMPPSRMCGAYRQKASDQLTANRDYTHGLIRSYHSHILNLFHFWRGSQRFTFVFKPTTPMQPIYVSFLPHSGARILGSANYSSSQLLIAGELATTATPGSMGLATEMVLPSINPTITVETPYALETNFAIMQYQDNQDNFSWRDKGETNSGHLVLWSNDNFAFDAWWAAGDDFTVSNFYGIPPCIMATRQYYMSDNYPLPASSRNRRDDSAQAESDFHNLDSDDSRHPIPEIQMDWVKQFLPRMSRPAAIAAASAIPVVGPAVATGYAVDQVLSRVDGVSESISAMTNKATTLLGKVEQLIPDCEANDVLSMISAKVACLVDVGSHLYHTVVDTVLDIFLNIANFSPTVLAVSIVRFMCNTMSVPFTMGFGHLDTIKDYISSLFVATSQGDIATEQLSASFWTEEMLIKGLGLFVSVVGTMLGVSVDKRDCSWTTATLNRITSAGGMSFINGTMRFVEVIFGLIKEACYRLASYFSVENRAILALQAKSKVIDQFIKESQLMLDESNATGVTDPDFKHRFWVNVVQAYAIQRQLASIPSNKVAPIVSKYCNDVIKAGREKMADLRSSPVRYEPFVIGISGASKIGKSFLATAVITELLNSIGFKCFGNPVYYRIQGSKHWNGHNGQIALVIDEWMNLTTPESVHEGAQELFQLKSPAVFIPEMAAIQEKNIRAAFKIVLILTNNPFPDSALDSVISCKEALYRRFDVKVEASRKAGYENVDLHSMSPEDKAAYNHIEFREYTDVTNRASLSDERLDYTSFTKGLCERFQDYDKHESENVRIRMEQLQTFWRTRTANLVDPFSLMYDGLVHVANGGEANLSGLPSELLELEVNRVASQLEDLDIDVRTGDAESEGLLTFVANLGSIAYARKFLNALYSYIARKRTPVSKMNLPCKGCNQDVAPFAVCQRSLDESVRDKDKSLAHPICRVCYDNITLGDGVRNCPCCNCEESVLVVEYRYAYVAWALYKLRKAGLDVIDVIHRLPVSWFAPMMQSVAMIGQLAGVMSATTAVQAATYSYDLEFSIMSFYGLAIMNRLGKFPQLQEEIEETIMIIDDRYSGIPHLTTEERVRIRNEYQLPIRYRGLGVGQTWASRRPDPMKPLYFEPGDERADPCIQIGGLDQTLPDHARVVMRPRPKSYTLPYSFNRANYLCDWDILATSDCVVGDVDERRCVHDDLISDIRSSKWEDGVFLIPAADRYHRMEWKRCKDYCSLDGVDKESLLRQYWDEHAPTTYEYIVMNYTTDDFKNKDILRIPSFMIPSWVAPSVLTNAKSEQEVIDSLEVPSGLRCLMRTLVVAVVVFSAFKGLKSIAQLMFGSATPQIISSGDEVVRKFKPVVKQLHHALPRHQMGNTDAITTKVAKNYFVIRTYCDDKLDKVLVGLGIRNRMGILPRHYYEYLLTVKDGVTMTIGPAIEAASEVRYTFCEEDFLTSDVSDLAVMYLPASYNMFSNIVKYFGRDGDLTAKYSNSAILVRVPTKQNNFISTVDLRLEGYKKHQRISGQNGTFVSLDNLVYNYSQAGACGSVVLLNNHTRPIRAMHIAGHGVDFRGTGYGAIITQEDIEQIAPDRVETRIQGVEEPDWIEDDIKMYLPEDSVVNYLGSLPKDKVPYSASKSAFKRSLVSDKLPWDTDMEPAILTHKDPRYTHKISPMLAGCAKHGYLTKDFASADLDEIASIRREQILAVAPVVVEPAKLTPEEAIVGIPDIKHYESIKLNTSVGWPWCATPKTTKKDWVDTIVDDQQRMIDCVVHPEVLSEVKRKEHLRKQGIVPLTVFVDTLKDEKKPKEKVLKLGGTRVFCASPLDFTIATRQVFLHFVAAFYSNRNSLSHGVGITMKGPGLTEFVNDLLAIGNNIVTLDYTNFGPGFNASVSSQVRHTIGAWVLKYVKGVEPEEVEALLEENINSVHAMGGTLYRQRGGSPSGSPLTVQINSEVNIMYIMLAWKHLVRVKCDQKELPPSKWREFADHVCVKVYGDDLIMSVSDKYIDVFNATTITDYFKEYGIAATDASKSAEIKPYTTILEATFLKHSFMPHPTRREHWIGALAWRSVLNTAHWIQEPIELEDATIINCEAALRDAYGHGPEKFNWMRSKLNAALAVRGLKPILLTWEELDDNFYG